MEEQSHLKSIFSLVKKKSLPFLFNLVTCGALALSGRASGTRVRASLETQMVMNLPDNAGNTGLILGLGRFHMLWDN